MSTKNKIKNIDLSPYRGINSTSFLGRTQGENVRVRLKLDLLEKNFDKLIFKIPSGTTSINPSFFLGLFYKTIVNLGDLEAFKTKILFRFVDDESEIIKTIVLDDIREALKYAKNSLIDLKRGFRL